MQRAPKTPADLVRRLAAGRSEGWVGEGDDAPPTETRPAAAWSRETFRLPRSLARDAARDWFERYPKSDFASEVESWRPLADGRVEFTLRRLPAAG